MASNKKAGAERRLSCYATNGAYFFFLAPPFFAAFFFFAAIVLSMERVLNAGPIPRWIGRQQPDANIRLVPRAGTSAQKTATAGLLNQRVRRGYVPQDDHHHICETGPSPGFNVKQS